MPTQKSLVVSAAFFAVFWIAGMALLSAFTSNGSLSAGSAISLAVGGTVAGIIWYRLTKRYHSQVS